jgi:uncharacterized membrane protein
VTSSLESLTSFASACLSYVPTLVLLWLGLFFGRTLRAGAVPLIERIARQRKPALSEALCRYTRRLTAVWCAYFVIAAFLTVAAHLGFRQASVGVAAVSALFFVGEYWLRLRLFPHEAFPNLVQQVRDTVQVWRPPRNS